jgi:hypothetical protein
MDPETSFMQSQIPAANYYGKSVIVEDETKTKAAHDSLIYETSMMKGSVFDPNIEVHHTEIDRPT